jgi:hypothetical protein
MMIVYQLWDMSLLLTIHSVKFVGPWKGPLVPARDVVLFAPVGWSSGACTGRNGVWRLLEVAWSHAVVAGSCLVTVQQLGSCLVVEPGCWKMPGRRAQSLEWWHAAAAPVTQCVGRGRWQVEAASCPVCWAWPPEGQGSCPGCSVEPMTPKAGHSGPSVMTDWLMWSLNRLGGHWRLLAWSCVFYTKLDGWSLDL